MSDYAVALPGAVARDDRDDRDDSFDDGEALMQFLYRVPIGLVQMVPDGTIEMANPKSVQLLMPLAEDGHLDNLFDLFQGVAPQLRALVAGFDAPSGAICQALRIAVAGRPGSVPCVLSLDLTKLDPARVMAVIGDATHEAEREQLDIARRLRHAARIDALTSMPNRVALIEQVQAVIDREPLDAGYEFAVLFLNCDRFREINDALGHQVGDEILALLGGRIRAELRPGDCVGRTIDSDQMAARINGDEFVVLLEYLCQASDVHVVAKRLLKSLSKPYLIAGRPVYCNVSIGVTIREHVAGDADLLLQDASIAMGEAKHDGGARYAIFDASMRERATRRGTVESDLRNAIAAGELYVVYQPVVGLQGSDAVDVAAGVEALVRWRHPERGLVPPIDFIAVAEQTGLIDALGAFVLETACRQFVDWRGALGDRAPRLVAVNVSRAQLTTGDFVASVAAILHTTGMPPACLQLEITESLAAQGETVQVQLHALRALGVTLALDDFGTGYSSLSSLHLLPVDTVKIDRSFVSLADTSAHHRVLIEATIRVARSLGMKTVAEGIETDEQAAVIRDLGCDKGQGYLYSRPIASDELSRWLTGDALQAA